jgi:signal transduction histidine kinase
VVNPGSEIPEYQRQQIFERFYRLDHVRNSEDNHYGLGLAIAKAIVTAHQGHIEVLCHNGLVEFRAKIPVL